MKQNEIEYQNEILLKILNDAFRCLRRPIYYEDFNNILPTINENMSNSLKRIEEKHPSLGLTYNKDTKLYGMSVLSIIATITRVYAGKSLAAMIDIKTGEIVSFKFLDF